MFDKASWGPQRLKGKRSDLLPQLKRKTQCLHCWNRWNRWNALMNVVGMEMTKINRAQNEFWWWKISLTEENRSSSTLLNDCYMEKSMEAIKRNGSVNGNVISSPPSPFYFTLEHCIGFYTWRKLVVGWISPNLPDKATRQK